MPQIADARAASDGTSETGGMIEKVAAPAGNQSQPSFDPQEAPIRKGPSKLAWKVGK